MASEQLREMFSRIHAGFRRRLAPGALLSDPEMRKLQNHLLSVNPKDILDTPIEEARFVVIDTETTGFKAYAGDEICSISLLEIQGLELTNREFSTLINPGRKIPPESTEIHHITDQDVADAPVIEEVLSEIVTFLDHSVLVGHHIGFDMRFLNRTLRRELMCHLKHPWLDTMMMYLAASGRMGHYTLEEVSSFTHVEIEGRHTAHGDAVTAAHVFQKLTRHLCKGYCPVQTLMERQIELGRI